MRRLLVAAAALLSLVLCTQAFSQSSYATLGGTISDGSGALIPGVSVTATNNATGVVGAVLSNEVGVYNLPGLLPGVYKVSAELPGFQIQTYTDVQLGNAAQVRLNFTLIVAALAQAVEVTVAADTLLAASSSSVGAVLPQQKVQDLPLVGNNVLDLIQVMAGVQGITTNAFGQEGTTFSGVSAREINIQRDGVSVNESRFPTGIRAATRMNPDLVGEIRLILTPVDAEMGRGNGQIQVETRSGTNQYRGSAVWYPRNSALNANTWSNNRAQPRIQPNYSNRNQYSASYGGPIVKNKTFFYAVWDQMIVATRQTNTPLVLTPCARNGIFRYFDSGPGKTSWNNGNAAATTVATGATPTIAVVDALGNPRPPATNPDGSTFTGTLRYASVFGQLLNTPARSDCSDAVIGPAPTATATWDPYRTKMDPSGQLVKQLQFIPPSNNYESGDGLNTAGFRWVQRLTGTDNIYGLDESTPRKQINVRIDHNFNSKHKASLSWSDERNAAPDYFMVFPDTTTGETRRNPSVWTANFVSTLSSTIVNEARFGYRVTGTEIRTPFDTPKYKDQARGFFPEVNGFRVVPQFGSGTITGISAGTANFQLALPMGSRGAFPNTNIDKTPLWTYADTISWTRGKHGFKGGGELRLSRSKSYSDGFFGGGGSAQTYVRAMGGELTSSLVAGINSTNMPGLAGTTNTGNRGRMEDLLTYLAGSIGSVNHRYWINSPKTDEWDDFRTSPYIIRDWHQNEFSFFFKDDWKVHKNLTLNLGVRYEYYGVPFINEGTTMAPAGGGSALFGYSGRGFDGWMKPGQRGDLTVMEFVGPNSPNPARSLWTNDWNNFGPAVGFAWQVPWFGADKTTIRGGYQITYEGGGRFYDLDTQGAANPPGSANITTYTGLNNATGVVKPYLDFNDALAIVPIPPLIPKPLQTVPVTDRSQVLVAFDPTYVSPYTQNMTLSVTRSLRSNMVVDVRYVGTMQVHGYRDLNLNAPNFLYNGLKEAFDSVRAGGESALLDQMFRGLNVAGNGFGAVGTTFNGVPQTAGLQMRASTVFNSNLANGNYSALATSLNTLVISTATNPGVPSSAAGLNGAVLRYNGFPENFIATNPQFSTLSYKTNLGHTNYHGVQVQTTLRPTHGLSFQGTYGWSKALGTGQSGTGAQGVAGSAPIYTNPTDRRGDYTLQASDRRHEFRLNGTFDLPFGPGRLLLGSRTGPLARIVEGWQVGWITNFITGAPTSVSAQNMLYASGVPDVVGPWANNGEVQWGGITTATGQINGSYWDPSAYTSVPDPQCALIAANLSSQNLCTLTAVADAKTGQILLQNPLPGTRGTLGQFTMQNPGTYRFDANISKSFRISETKSMLVRIDTTNVLNHPSPADPNLNINLSTTTPVPFGAITNKAGSRTFQGHVRLNF